MRPQHIIRFKNIRYLSTPIPNIDKNKNKYDKNKDGEINIGDIEVLVNQILY